VVLLGWFPSAGALETALARELQASVVRVEAIDARGAVSSGSAVMIAADTYITACHVVNGAERIFLRHGIDSAVGHTARADTAEDLCILEAGAAFGTPAQIAVTLAPAVGDTVYAVGFEHGRGLTISSGRIYALHDVRGGMLIQTSAVFEGGASGGGLFDDRGRLIGVLSFYGQAHGPYYFALPVAWLDALPAAAPSLPAAALWMRPIDEQPRFLQALTRTAEGDWDELARVALHWTAEEPDRAAPWLALGAAYVKLDRAAQARAAYLRAMALEPDRLDELRRLKALYEDARNDQAAAETALALRWMEQARGQESLQAAIGPPAAEAACATGCR
jgi:hypothetical protein